MKKIMVIQSSGKANGNTAQLVNSFVRGAQEKGHSVEVISLVKNEVKPCLGCNACRNENPPFGRYEKYPIKDCDLLMTAADNNFWTFEQAASYYQYAFINYIGFRDKGMLLAGGCGHTDGKPQIDKTNHLKEAYEFGKKIYP